MKLVVVGLLAGMALPLSLAVPASGGPIDDALLQLARGHPAIAAKMLLLLASKGDARAQYELATFYDLGIGVSKDRGEEMKWLTKAADQGYAEAEYSLGQIFEEGRTWETASDRQLPPNKRYPVRNLAEAAKWLTKAADQGQENARRLLGRLAVEAENTAVASTVPGPRTTEVALGRQAGTFVVPVVINDTITLEFTLDSGASDVAIPSDVVSTLMRAGTVEAADFLGSKTYTLADGSTVPSQTFRIRSMKVGDQVLKDVVGSISPASGVLLLGQSFLGNFQSWSIDNQRGVLILTP